MEPKILDQYVLVNSIDPTRSWDDNVDKITDPYILLFLSVKAEAEGRYDRALDLAEQALKSSDDDTIAEFASMVMIFFSNVRLETSEDLQQEISEIDTQLVQLRSHVNKDNTAEFYNFHFFSATYYTAKSTYAFYFSKYHGAIDHNWQAIEAWQTINETAGVNLVAIDLQFCYNRTGQFDKALESSDALMERLDPSQDKLTLCHALLSRSETFKLRGNYRSAATLLEEAYHTAEELQIEELIFHSMRFLADVYCKQGYYDQAWDLQQQALDHFSSSNPLLRAEILQDIADTARLKQEYHQAREFYFESIAAAQKVKSYDVVVDCHYHLILTAIAGDGDNEELQQYLAEIVVHIDLVEDPRYDALPQLGRALVLLTEDRLEKRYEALPIFRQILHDLEVYHEYRLTSIYHLTEMLIDEYTFTGSLSVLEEIKSILDIMEDIGSALYSNQVVIDYHLLMMKLHRELGDQDQVFASIDRAKKIADESKVPELVERITSEETILRQELQLHPLMHSTEYRDIDTIGSISSFLQDLKQGRIPATQPLRVDPQIVMISSKGGVNLYSKQFDKNMNPELNLMASFLSAMMDFSEEAFQDTSTIELIKLGTRKLVLHNTEQYILCYIYSGNTPKAIHQLNQFAEKLKNLKTISSNLSIGLLEPHDAAKLSAVMEQIFLPLSETSHVARNKSRER